MLSLKGQDLKKSVIAEILMVSYLSNTQTLRFQALCHSHEVHIQLTYFHTLCQSSYISAAIAYTFLLVKGGR